MCPACNVSAPGNWCDQCGTKIPKRMKIADKKKKQDRNWMLSILAFNLIAIFMLFITDGTVM